MRKITYKDKSWMIERFRKILRFIPEQVFENKKEWEEFLNEQEKKKA